MKVVKADGTTERELLTLLKQRSGDMNAQITQSAAQIIELVRAGGDEAVRRLTEQYDGVAPENIVVDRRQIEASLETRDSKFVYALYRAADNIRDYHARQKREGFINARPDGVMMGQRVRPLKRVGLYVPGGTAAYPSTVLMNAIPAKIAGVEELVMVTPPAKTGFANPNILAAAAVAGVDKIYLMGGAQAVAALAYGTETVQRVDKIVGPGNAYVAAAKKLLYGTVDIDMIAGPSEILIVADGTANPKFLAADLMSQAEHDVMASAILLTTSEQLAKDTIAEINRQKKDLSRREIITKSLDTFGAVIICDTIEQAIAFANEVAPEHLELALDRPMDYLGMVENAGSVFLGHYCPEPLGDYYAGPNHVLPTNGTARFFSPLSVDSFMKKSSFLYYTPQALEQAKDDVIRLAESEGLTAHANSIKVRF